jgi:hypothetical protein
MNVYSCGCLLHYLCTGQPPFQSDSLQRLAALHASNAVVVPSQLNPDIPEHLERVIAQCLERDLRRRIASPAALVGALTHVEATWRASGVRKKVDVQAAAPPPSPPQPPPPAAKRERTVVPEFDLVMRLKPGSERTTGVVAGRSRQQARPAPQAAVPPLPPPPPAAMQEPHELDGQTTVDRAPVGGSAVDRAVTMDLPPLGERRTLPGGFAPVAPAPEPAALVSCSPASASSEQTATADARASVASESCVAQGDATPRATLVAPQSSTGPAPAAATASASVETPPDRFDFDPHERTTSVGELDGTSSTPAPPTLIPRDSLSDYEVSHRESTVSAREDYVFRTLETRAHSRRWRWGAAAGIGIGIGAYVSLLALVHSLPQLQHTAASATPEHTPQTLETVRIEGQAFPLDSSLRPRLEPRPEPAPAEVATASARKGREPDRNPDSHFDAAPSNKSSSGTPIANRESFRRTERLLDSMQPTREPVAAPRPAISERVIVNIPSSRTTAPAPPVVAQGRAPAPLRPPAVAGELWATPTVVDARELRPRNGRPANIADPPAARAIVDTPPRSSTPQARTENLEVRGSLSDQTVRRAIDRIRPQLSDCFAQHGAGTNNRSVAHVELTIDETGRTRDARVRGTTPALDECLTQASRKLVAGAPDTGTVKVVWNLRYGR